MKSAIINPMTTIVTNSAIQCLRTKDTGPRGCAASWGSTGSFNTSSHFTIRCQRVGHSTASIACWSRKVVLATVGSLGDLHPFIALGQALNAHGVNVLIASAPEYQSKVEGAGLRFHSLRPGFEELQHDLGMSRAELARRVVRRSDFLFRKLVLPYLRAA